jgi:DNA polymerase-4
MPKYKQIAQRIQQIFHEYTDLVEPLSLDEAYLDVTNSKHYHGSATLIAKAIRERIYQTENLIASAGVAPNKFLAKIASGWKKPNSLFVILPEEITSFISALPVRKLHGVGKVTAEKLHSMNLQVCADLQKLSLRELTAKFGKFGQRLYEQCRGIDSRPVEPNRHRKSLSVEHTFEHDLDDKDLCVNSISELYQRLLRRLEESACELTIKNQYLKIKFNDFKQTTAEISSKEVKLEKYLALFQTNYMCQKPIRLIGLGVHFNQPQASNGGEQQSLFP